MNIIGNKYIFLTLSGLLVVASIVAIAQFGLRKGIDFTGGTLWQIRTHGGSNAIVELNNVLKQTLKIDAVTIVEEESTKSILVRMQETNEVRHQEYLKELTKVFPNIEELRFESIGPTIGGELRSAAIWAFFLVLLGISLYVAFAFRAVSYPVSSWKYGLITLVTLFHDAIIPTGMYAVLGKLFQAEIDTNFVVAILVVMGFSVHDTIVVFDRIRENLRLERNAKTTFSVVVNKSVNETLVRSVNTSLTLILVLLALYFFGGATLHYFILIILVGTVVGTYSSIFIASPLLTIWNKEDRVGK